MDSFHWVEILAQFHFSNLDSIPLGGNRQRVDKVLHFGEITGLGRTFTTVCGGGNGCKV